MKKINLIVISLLLSILSKSQTVYSWQFWTDVDSYHFEHEVNSSGNFIEDFRLVPINKLYINVDSLITNSDTITHSDIVRWDSKLSSVTLSITGNTLSAGSNSVTLPSQATQTLTGLNGVTVVSGVNTFTISKSKRQETYSGTTNSSGVYSVTFSQAYSVAPNIQANIIGGTANQFLVITSISTTGFTVNAYQRNAVTLLATEVLLASTVNVNGANVDVLITEK